MANFLTNQLSALKKKVNQSKVGQFFAPVADKVRVRDFAREFLPSTGKVLKEVARGSATFAQSAGEAVPRLITGKNDTVVAPAKIPGLGFLGPIQSYQSKFAEKAKKGGGGVKDIAKTAGQIALDEPIGLALKPLGIGLTAFAKGGGDDLVKKGVQKALEIAKGNKKIANISNDVVNLAKGKRDDLIKEMVEKVASKKTFAQNTSEAAKNILPKAETTKAKTIGLADSHSSYTPRMKALIKEAQEKGETFPFTKFTPEEQQVFDRAFRGEMETFVKGGDSQFFGRNASKNPTDLNPHTPEANKYFERIPDNLSDRDPQSAFKLGEIVDRMKQTNKFEDFALDLAQTTARGEQLFKDAGEAVRFARKITGDESINEREAGLLFRGIYNNQKGLLNSPELSFKVPPTQPKGGQSDTFNKSLVVKNGQPQPLDIPAEKIRVTEESIKTKYRQSGPSSVQGFSKADEELANIYTEMELSRPGERVFIPAEVGGGSDVKGIPSTFPKWIPEHLRSKELFNKVLGNLELEKLQYPTGNRPKQRALYDAILSELDSRLGINTVAERAQIKALYEQAGIAKSSSRGVRGGGTATKLGAGADRGVGQPQVLPPATGVVNKIAPIIEAQLKQSGSGNIYIKAGDRVINKLPRTIQNDIYSHIEGENLGLDRFTKASNYLQKHGLSLEIDKETGRHFIGIKNSGSAPTPPTQLAKTLTQETGALEKPFQVLEADRQLLGSESALPIRNLDQSNLPKKPGIPGQQIENIPPKISTAPTVELKGKDIPQAPLGQRETTPKIDLSLIDPKTNKTLVDFDELIKNLGIRSPKLSDEGIPMALTPKQKEAFMRGVTERMKQGLPAINHLEDLKNNPFMAREILHKKWTRPMSMGEIKSLDQIAKKDMSLASASEVSVGQPLTKMIEKMQTPVKQKVNAIDYLRTPERVLNKIGLAKEGTFLREQYDKYIKELPKNIEKITEWSKRVPPEANERIFKYLDGQPIDLNRDELRVATEIRHWLQQWADRLELPHYKRIADYITHIFDDQIIKKEFDEDLAKIISGEVAGGVYDPFLQKRAGVMGYKQDTWAALDAYVKRATRKVHMDPALERMKTAAEGMEESQWNYIKRYIDRVNFRPTELENLFDNWLKVIPGVEYKLGQRPVAKISRTARRLVYRGLLGLNPASALRNLSQGANTYAKLGGRYTAIGYTRLFSSEARKELAEQGVLDAGFIQDRTLDATKKFWETVDKGLWSLFQGAEYINRGGAYFGAKAKAIAGGATEEQAIAAAKKMVRDTQFSFGSIDTPVLLNDDIVKTVTQLQSFTIKQTEFLAGMLKNKEYAGFARYALSGLAFVYTIGQIFGMKPEELIPTVRFGAPPTIKAPWEALKAFADKPDKYGNDRTTEQKVSDVFKAGTSYIPAGNQIFNKTIPGVSSYLKGGVADRSGNIKYPIEKSGTNFLRGALLGKYSFPESQEVFDYQDRLKELKDERKEDKEAAADRVEPLYQQVEQLKTEGRIDEAKTIVDGLTDDEYEAYRQIRMTNIYDQVQELKESNMEEAKTLIDSLSDKDYKLYTKIKNEREGTATNQYARAKMLPIYEQVQQLKVAGQIEEAKAIVDGLTDEEYKVYKAIKDSLK